MGEANVAWFRVRVPVPGGVQIAMIVSLGQNSGEIKTPGFKSRRIPGSILSDKM